MQEQSDDSRVEVESPECYPNYSPIGIVEVYFNNGGHFRGTGFLIANDIVATAAHNLYEATYGGYATSITFTPSAEEPAYAPFGRATAIDVAIPDEYINGLSPSQFDYAAFQIDLPLGIDTSANRFNLRMATSADLLENCIRVTGYPLEAHGEPTGDMWTAVSAGWLTDGSTRINYFATTSVGQSGSPIVLENDPRYVIGIHTDGPSESSLGNSGVFFTERVYDFLTSAFTHQ